jgi:DNA polymerase III subunit gamma/tau
VPEASLDAEALLARIERLERRLSIAGTESPAPAGPVPAAAEPATRKASAPAAPVRSAEEPARAAPASTAAAVGSDPAPGRSETQPREVPAASTRPRSKARTQAAAEPPVEEAGWGPAEAPARVPVDLDLVRRSWPLVLERVRATPRGRVTATFLSHGRPVALEGRQLVVELPRDRKFEAEALTKDGRNRQVDGVLEAMLGGGLEIRVVVGEHAGPEEPDPPPADAAPPAPDQVVEFEVDPANDEGRPLDADADARAVADWAAKELGGKVIEERPNDSGAKGGARGARKGR